jgi:hypothetical protein
MTSFDLEAWAAKSRILSFPKAREPDDILAFGDMDSMIFLAHRAGNYVVETRSHSSRRTFIGSFDNEDDALRLVVYWIGTGNTNRDPGNHGGFEGVTLDESPIAVHLEWPGGAAEFGPGQTGTFWARRFNWTRGKSLEQIAGEL